MQDLEKAVMQELPAERTLMDQQEKVCEPKEWEPTNQEALQEYELGIRFLSRGCIVRVGCKEIAFEDINKAMAEINEYVTGNTWEARKKWRKLLGI